MERVPDYRHDSDARLGAFLVRLVDCREGLRPLVLTSPEKAAAQYAAAMDEMHGRALKLRTQEEASAAAQRDWVAADDARIDAALAEEISEEDVRQAVGPDLPVSTVWALLRKAYELGQTHAWNGGDY